MALGTRPRKPDPTKIYVAWQGFTTEVDGEQYVFERGTRLRGSHPAVKRMGEAAFVPDGVPPSEWPSVFDAVVAAAEAKPAPPKPKPRIDPSTPIGELLICIRGITMSKAGPCAEGYLVTRDHPLAKVAPECFASLTERLG